MNIRKFICVLLSAVIVTGSFAGCGNKRNENSVDTSNDINIQITQTPEEEVIQTATINNSFQEIIVDGESINWDENTVYRGLGVVTGNNSSRLLMDYKTENPEAYWEIMNLLFKPDYGAGLTHIKIEFGSDVNSSSGTEPSIMRSEDEEADVTRGAGFMFAADALSINPDISVDLLRWGEPKWITDAFEKSQEEGLAARYKWYKAALDSAYDTYGIKFTHISADGNEPAQVDVDWILYLAEHLENETDERYDYGAIKIVASDEVGSWNIAKAMIENEELRDAVDVLGEHYNTWASDNAKLLNMAYGKEIWYSEGVAPTNIAKLAVSSNGCGINGTNGALDVCNRIINGYYNGKMTMYEYQPAVAAYYSGAKFFPKSLINAQNPWSGYYEADCGIWTSAHFTMFMKDGWRYIDSACYGDGKENHSISETTNNYMTVTDTETGDYSIVVCNDSDTVRSYTFTLTNMDKADAPITIWETRGPDERQEYDANYLKKIGKYLPVENNGNYSFSVEVKPYSIITITTLNKNFDTSVAECTYEDIPLKDTYIDDFEYSDEFLSSRGNAPLYTTDYGGAFEVAETVDGKVLMQMINEENKPTDWRLRGTPNPITSLGDDRWSNYSAEIDFKFDGNESNNYIMFGIRYLIAELNTNTAENGYLVKINPNGSWNLKLNWTELASGTVSNFDSTIWHNIKITAAGCQIAVELDGETLAECIDDTNFAHSGRVCIGSGLYNNVYDNLKISPVDGMESTVTRLDDHDSRLYYSGYWTRTVPEGYVHFNRTLSTGDGFDGEKSEQILEFDFTGSHFAIIGKTSSTYTIEVYDNNVLVETVEAGDGTNSRECSYVYNTDKGEHNIKIRVIGGKLTIDAVEYY
ncbi:MAG: hypothetical protein ACI39R_01010 [Lachnospiraceae bacterium]